MKKLYLLLVGFLLIPTLTFASSSYGDLQDGKFFASGNDYYAVGGTVNISQDIAGDLHLIGGMLNVDSKVGQDLGAIGGMITISSDVGDDLRIIGGNITVDGNITGDLIINGGQILVKKNVKVGGNLIINGGNILFNGDVLGDAYINGGTLNLDGNISGNAELRAEQIFVGSGVTIKGNVVYYSKVQNIKLESITSGTKEFKILEEKLLSNKKVNKEILGFVGAYMVYLYLFLLVFGAIIYFAFEKLFRETAVILEKNYWKSFFLGLTYYAIFPFVILLFFATVIGIPFGLFLLFAYIFSFVFYKLFIVIVFSALIINKYLTKGKILKKPISFWKKLGIIALVALVIIPWSLIDLFIAFFAVGAISMRKFEIIKSLR